MHDISPADLEAYLDEALPSDQMAQIENLLRSNPTVARQAALVHSRRDAGVHSLGEVWRRARLTCPTRDQWGSFLLGVLSAEAADYYRFHLDALGCRLCQANVADLQSQQSERQEVRVQRRSRYFASSAGYLRREKR